MATDKDAALIYPDDWFEDSAGRRWALVYIDVDAKRVRLRSMDPPQKTVSLAELRTKYKLTGLRAYSQKKSS